MQVKAKAKYIRISPRKVRLVVDLVRGKDIAQAIGQLSYSKKGAALPVKKLIESALANATNNFELKENNLYIKEITANDGPTLKRWMPRAHGRATPLRKRSTHIAVTLEEKVPTEPKKDKKEAKKNKKAEIKVVTEQP